MRAVFTLDLPEQQGGGFPNDEEILSLLKKIGWEFEYMESMTTTDISAIMRTQQDISYKDVRATEIINNRSVETPASNVDLPKDDINPTKAHYMRLSAPMFKEMPEVAGAERGAVIFLGYISSDKTLFVVTRMVPGQLTFRLLHRELPYLQSSTVRLVDALLSARLKDRPLTASSPQVSVYERGLDHVLISGRVITKPLQETFRSNLKDTLLFFVPLGLFVPTFIALFGLQENTTGILYGTLERFNTALLTTSIVSMLGLAQSWIQLRRSRRIEWKVSAEVRLAGG